MSPGYDSADQPEGNKYNTVQYSTVQYKVQCTQNLIITNKAATLFSQESISNRIPGEYMSLTATKFTKQATIARLV